MVNAVGIAASRMSYPFYYSMSQFLFGPHAPINHYAGDAQATVWLTATPAIRAEGGHLLR